METKTQKQKTNQSSRAGLIFPIGRIGRYMRMKKYNSQVETLAPVFLAAVMEYLCAEILEMSGEICQQQDKKRITPRHIELAVREDKDFERFFQNKTFINAGTAPPLENVPLKKQKLQNLEFKH